MKRKSKRKHQSIEDTIRETGRALGIFSGDSEHVKIHRAIEKFLRKHPKIKMDVIDFMVPLLAAMKNGSYDERLWAAYKLASGLVKL